MKGWLEFAVFGAATLFAAPASATVVTFSNVTPFYFTGQQSEAGFQYAVTSGVLYGNTLGNSGGDLEGSVLSGGGAATFTQLLGGTFTFSGLDYAAFNGTGLGSQTLVVRGYLNGVLVGTDRFALGNTGTYLPTLDNWTTFNASVLANRNINSLQIALGGAWSGTNQKFQALDNVRFGAAIATPEASTWAMMLLGFGCAGVALRRGRKREVAAA